MLIQGLVFSNIVQKNYSQKNKILRYVSLPRVLPRIHHAGHFAWLAVEHSGKHTTVRVSKLSSTIELCVK